MPVMIDADAEMPEMPTADAADATAADADVAGD